MIIDVDQSTTVWIQQVSSSRSNIVYSASNLNYADNEFHISALITYILEIAKKRQQF